MHKKFFCIFEKSREKNMERNMLKEMLCILSRKSNEIVVFFVSVVATNVAYNGFYRWYDPLVALALCFFVYFVYGRFNRIEEPWRLGDCIERNRWRFLRIIILMSVMVTCMSMFGARPLTVPIVILVSACGVWTVIFMDKARYLERV